MKFIKIIPLLSIILGSQIQNNQVIIKSDEILEVLKKSPILTINANSNVIISMPSLDGTLKAFQMFYSPVMPHSLIKKYPGIKTYTGIGVVNPSERISVTFSENKIKGMILGNNGNVFIDHVKGSKNLYNISKREIGVPVSHDCIDCESIDIIERIEVKNSRTTRNFPSCVGEDEPCYVIGDTLVTFRFAGILTSEANNEIGGGNILGGLAWMNAMVNQVNLLWVRELSFRLELIEDSDLLIYTNDNPTPEDFTQFNMYDELPLVLNHLNETVGPGGYNAPIGLLNWEYGAVFNIGYSGGLAYVPGSTSANLPYYEIFNHEIGHNLGSSHNCTSEGGWRCTFGGTIMCSRSNTLSSSGGDQYSSHTIDIAIKYQQEMFGGNAYLYQRGFSRNSTDNLPPVVNLPFDFITIPMETPFVLEGSAEDENIASLTYSWEQNDITDVAFSPPAFPEDSGPLFCSVDPKLDGNIRYFPQMSSLLDNNYATGNIEKLPFAAREINMRLIVRDNDLFSGGVSYDNVILNVLEDAGPFRITSQSDVVTWEAGASETITWDVANTDNINGVNSPMVEIYLSIDGGDNFDIVLDAGTPNDGNEDIIVPIVPTSNECRIMVKSLNNVFFDINNSFFIINNPAIPQLDVDTSTIELNLPLDTLIAVEREILNSGDTGSILTYALDLDYEYNGDGFLSFDGQNDFVDLGSNLLSGSGNFSITLWFKTTHTNEVIIQQRNGGFNGEYQLNINGNGQLDFWTYRDGYRWSVLSQGLVNDGNWHHIVLVQDEIINGGRMYLDGLEVSNSSDGLVNLDGSIHSYLGADMRDNVNYFSGSIDAVGILSVALSSTTIESIYLGGKSFNLSYNHDGYSAANDLEAFYPVRLMSGTTLSDFSGNGHDGNISGADWDGDLVPVPDWLAVSDASSWLEAGESNQVNIEINTSGLEENLAYVGYLLILTDGDVTSIPIHLITSDGLDVDSFSLPNKINLYSSYPNPFNPLTTLHYDLREEVIINISIYDMMGRNIKTFINGPQSAGYKTIQWDATNNQGQPVSAGVYLYSIEAGDFRQTKKMVLLK